MRYGIYSPRSSRATHTQYTAYAAAAATIVKTFLVYFAEQMVMHCSSNKYLTRSVALLILVTHTYSHVSDLQWNAKLFFSVEMELCILHRLNEGQKCCVVKIMAKRALTLLNPNAVLAGNWTADKLKQIDFVYSIYDCFALMHVLCCTVYVNCERNILSNLWHNLA